MKNVFLEKSIGIDIREESVSLTLLGKKLRTIEILAGKTLSIKPLTGKDEKAEKSFLNKINKFLIENDTWPESVVVSLPRSYITFKTFELPSPDLESVKSMVEFELERQFSSGLGDLFYSFQITPKSENNFHIASAAIKKEIANYYLDLIQKLNLKSTILDISTFANVNLAFTQEIKNDSSVWALAEINSQALDVAIIKNEVIEFSRNLTWDMPGIKEANSEEIINTERLECLSKDITKIIVGELQQALSSCRNIEADESIGHIYITGGGTLTTHIRQQLEKETEVSTTNLSCPETTILPDSFSSDLMLTSLSLGLRELKKQKIETNLLPKDLHPKRKKLNLQLTLALAATVVLLLAGWFVNKTIYANRTLTNLNQQFNQIKGQIAGLEKIDLEYESLKQYVNILSSIKTQYPDKLPVLGELSRALPKDTWLTHIKFKEGEMEVKGYSPVASKLIPILEQSKVFKETEFVGTIISETAGEKFTIRANLETAS